MIVKIQRPIFTNTTPYALVYNQGRSLEKQIPMKNVASLFGADEYKIYHEASWVGGTLLIGDRVPDQDW